MIHVPLAEEPEDFEKIVRAPGLRALAELVGEVTVTPRRGRPRPKRFPSREQVPPEDFPPYWTHALPAMRKAYKEICAYSCFRIHSVTGASSIDHMAPKSRDWCQVYEWNNYRLAASRMNARKGNFEGVIDPCGKINGWFELDLVGFQVIPSAQLALEQRSSVLETVERLKLNDPLLRQTREGHAQDYWDGEVTLTHLHRESPFVARELERQGLT